MQALKLDRYRLTVHADGTLVGPSGRVLKPFADRDGYLRVNVLTSGGNRRQVGVHALVCEAFHGPRPDGMQAAHGNGIVTDNRACNLRWATQAENEADKFTHGTAMQGTRHHSARLTEDDVRAIREASGAKLRELAVQYGVSEATVSQIITRKTWRHI